MRRPPTPRIPARARRRRAGQATPSHPRGRTTGMEFGQDVLDLDLEPLPEPGAADSMLPRHLSPSSASMFQQCPRKWKHRYVDRMPDPPGIPGVGGHVCASGARAVVVRAQGGAHGGPGQGARPHRVARDRTPSRLSGPASRRCRSRGPFGGRAGRPSRACGESRIPTIVEVHSTEQDVRVHLAEVPFRGIVDRVDVEADGLVIADYKSGKAPSDRYADARLAQVLLYAAALSELSGQRPARARLLYLDQRIIEVDVTEDNIAEVIETLRATWQELQAACDRGRVRGSHRAIVCVVPVRRALSRRSRRGRGAPPRRTGAGRCAGARAAGRQRMTPDRTGDVRG